MLKLSHPDKIQNTYVFIHRITYVHARLHVIYVDYFGCLVGWYYYVCNFNKCEIMVYKIYKRPHVWQTFSDKFFIRDSRKLVYYVQLRNQLYVTLNQRL